MRRINEVLLDIYRIAGAPITGKRPLCPVLVNIIIVIILGLYNKARDASFFGPGCHTYIVVEFQLHIGWGIDCVKGETDVSLLNEPLCSVTTVIVGLISS